MHEYCDLRIEILTPNKKEVEQIKDFFHGSNWTARIHTYYNKIVVKDRFENEDESKRPMLYAINGIRKITKKRIEVNGSHHWYFSDPEKKV